MKFPKVKFPKIKKGIWYSLIGGLITATGLMLLLCQMQFGFIDSSDKVLLRFFVEICFIMISLFPIGTLYNYPKRIVLYSVITFVILNVFTYITGFGLDMLESSGSDFGVPIMSGTFMLDSLGTQVLSWVPILKTIYAMVPGIIVVVQVIMFIAGDGPDEYFSVLIETGIVVLIFVIFGIVGNRLGFGWT